MKVSAEGKNKDITLDELQMAIYLVSEQLKITPVEFGRTRYGKVFGGGIVADYHVSRKANIFITVERVDWNEH